MVSNNVYLFIPGLTGSVTSWMVPAGVTGIKVECYGSSNNINLNASSGHGNYPGASYSRVNNLTVTQGQTITFGFGTSTWASTTGSVPTTTSQGCLAVSDSVAQASQVSSNIGDVKFAGGNGTLTFGSTLSGCGGQAGSSGPGANSVNFSYSTTPEPSWGQFPASGGGASGGTPSTGVGVIPKGRFGSTTLGRGGYWDGTNYIAPTHDASIQASYLNGLLQNNLYSYGSFGGSTLSYDGASYSANNSYPGCIVITLVAGRKYIVVNTRGTTTFTAPSDFGSLVSFEAIGDGGNGDSTSSGTSRYGGGGGGGYSKNTSTALLANPIIAGATQLSAILTSGSINYIRIEDGQGGGFPNNSTAAFAGGNGSLNSAGSGGSAVNGSINYSGGAGGAGSTVTRLNAGGGGGAAGPLGPGGIGGAANNNGANRGGGGGGGANNGVAGTAANTVTPYRSGNGGAGSSGASAGGTGNSAAAPNTKTLATNGTSYNSVLGGGGGGGGGFGVYDQGTGGYVDNSVYRIAGGLGGQSFPIQTDGSLVNYPGAGGGGGPTSTYSAGGLGLVVMAYIPTFPYPNGNFFFLE